MLLSSIGGLEMTPEAYATEKLKLNQSPRNWISAINRSKAPVYIPLNAVENMLAAARSAGSMKRT
jgi:hypothetical protein